jgi:hypothetical protein
VRVRRQANPHRPGIAPALGLRAEGPTERWLVTAGSFSNDIF